MDNILSLFSFNFAKPCKNVTYDKYNHAKYIILGHFTTSSFLGSILKDGLKAPKCTGNISNKEIIEENYNNYIYLTGHFDRVFSQNAVKKFGGNEILILLKIKKDTLELDDVNRVYSKKGISLTSVKDIYNALTQTLFSQCRTTQNILPNQIIEILDIEKIIENKFLFQESYSNRKSLTFEELKEKIDINLLKWNKEE